MKLCACPATAKRETGHRGEVPLPKQIAEAGLTERDLSLGRPALRKIISEYTREAGCASWNGRWRSWRAKWRGVWSKVERPHAAASFKLGRVTVEDLAKLLGPPKFIPDERQRAGRGCIANGLAWTQAGGESSMSRRR